MSGLYSSISYSVDTYSKFLRYPFIGSGPHLAPNLHVVISQMRKQYGKVFSLYLGNDPFVIVSDFELYKEAMSKDELLYRPKLGANDDFMFPDEHGEIIVTLIFTVELRDFP